MGTATQYRVKGMEVWVLERGEDLLEGLVKLADERGVKQAVVLSSMGSLTTLAARNPAGPSFPPPIASIRETGPFELLGLTGNIGDVGVNDSLHSRAHIHVMASDRNGKVLGGSLESGSTVFYKAWITVAVLEEMDC